MIVLQDKQQIEAIFEKYFRTIYGNCAWQLFLGSLELENCKYYSELLGKETIHAYTYTKNYGRQGGSSRQENWYRFRRRMGYYWRWMNTDDFIYMPT